MTEDPASSATSGAIPGDAVRGGAAPAICCDAALYEYLSYLRICERLFLSSSSSGNWTRTNWYR